MGVYAILLFLREVGFGCVYSYAYSGVAFGGKATSVNGDIAPDKGERMCCLAHVGGYANMLIVAQPYAIVV